MHPKIYSFLLLVFLLNSCSKQNDTLFTRLTADETGITFTNKIIQTNERNVFNFEYVLNGGGVALGDFNNDSLVDVYFTGNQVENKLYLNKGGENGLKFEDITEKSKATGEGKWCSGATVIDINNDKLLDIYVSATVNTDAKMVANMMYVNQGINKNGIPIFKDMAQEYGIADISHTTNAAFFDFDNDGDLDIYLLVNEMEKVRYPNKYVEKLNDGSSKRTDKLYKNDGTNAKPHFTNVSKQASILIEGYGLGVNITDINRDGWKDIYVTNDFLSDDILYINNKNGTFTDQSSQYFKHTSFSAMGNDVEDLNNDGLVEIVALDMLPEDNFRKKTMIPANNYSTYQNNEKYHYNYQYSRNTLQVNQGKNPVTGQPVFSEAGLFAGIAETDWSWCPMVTDFDNDGFRDIIITNGFPKDVTDHDYLAYRYQNAVVGKSSLQELLTLLPEVKPVNYAFKNKGFGAGEMPVFQNITKEWGMDTPSFSNGAAYADLDNDGDLDYVVNNINDSAFVYRNNAIQQKPDESHFLRIKCKGNENNINGIGAWIEISYGENEKQVYENTPFRGYLSTIENVAHFGLRNVKIVSEVKVIWQSGKTNIYKNVKANQTLVVDEKDAKTIFENYQPINNPLFTDITNELKINYLNEESDYIDFNIQKLIPHKFSQSGPAIIVGDVNGDGFEDAFIGGSAYHSGTFLLQNKDGSFIKKKLINMADSTTKLTEDAGVLLFDADKDGDNDLYIVSGSNEFPAGSASYQDKFYENDKGNFVENKSALPTFLKSGSCIKAVDFDKDGDLDLFIGGRVEVNAYPKPVNSYILRNDSKNNIRFTNITKDFAPQLTQIGMISDAIWSDFDNDSWPDLILAGELMPITILKNKAGKKLEKIESSGLKNKLGMWNSLISGDFDKDGDVDYVAGNQGTNTMYRASEKFPLTVYGKDFNQDGLYDAIPTVYFPNNENERKEVVYNTRDDLFKQITAFKNRFESYAKFALASIYETFSIDDMQDVLKLQANYMKTSYIENIGNGDFKMTELPSQAQTAPIFGMLAEDFNKDGNPDILMVGNDYGNEISVGRLDAFNGLLLTGNGKGSFKPISLQNSGFYVPGDAKALAKIKNAKGENLLFSTQNRGELKVFRLNNN